MYKISGLVKEGALGRAVQALHEHVSEVRVEPIGEAPVAAPVPASMEKKVWIKGSTKPKRKYKFAPRPNYKRDGKLQNAALAILDQYGVAPFELRDFVQKVDAAVHNRPAATRALRIRMKEGKVNKIRPGLYQRSPSAVAGSAGIGKLG